MKQLKCFGYVPTVVFWSHSPETLQCCPPILYRQPLDCFPRLIDEEVK